MFICETYICKILCNQIENKNLKFVCLVEGNGGTTYRFKDTALCSMGKYQNMNKRIKEYDAILPHGFSLNAFRENLLAFGNFSKRKGAT